MTIRTRLSFGLAGVPLLFFVAGALEAQQCSTATTAGKYVVVCDGYLTPAPNAPMVPAKLISVATADYDGQIKAAGTISIGGQIVSQVAAGKEKMNPDCTGTVAYTQTINGQPGPALNFTFVVSDFGNRIDGLSTDSGTVFSCVLRRASFNISGSLRQPDSQKLAVGGINAIRTAPSQERLQTASMKAHYSTAAETTNGDLSNISLDGVK